MDSNQYDDQEKTKKKIISFHIFCENKLIIQLININEYCMYVYDFPKIAEQIWQVTRAAFITISWNSVSRNLHVNSFYLELPEVVSARLLLRCFVTVAQQDRYFHGGSYWLLLCVDIIKPVHLARTASTCFHPDLNREFALQIRLVSVMDPRGRRRLYVHKNKKQLKSYLICKLVMNI